jgi:hypothetical protein
MKFIQPGVSYSLRSTPEGNMILVGEYIFIFPEPVCYKCFIISNETVLNIIWQIVHGTSIQIPLNIMISWRVLYIGQNNYHFRPLGADVERTLSFTLYLLFVILYSILANLSDDMFFLYRRPKTSSDKIRKKTLYWPGPVNIIHLLHDRTE